MFESEISIFKNDKRIFVQDETGFVLEIAFKNSKNETVIFDVVRMENNELEITFAKKDVGNKTLHLSFDGSFPTLPIVSIEGKVLRLPENQLALPDYVVVKDGQLILNADPGSCLCLHCEMPHASWLQQRDDVDSRRQCFDRQTKTKRRFERGDFETFSDNDVRIVQSNPRFVSIDFVHTTHKMIRHNEIILKFVNV